MRRKTQQSEAPQGRTGRPNPEARRQQSDPAGQTGRTPRPTTGGPQRAMHRCCRNCVYAARASGRWLRVVMSRWPGLLICANSAEAPGTLQGVAPGGVCPNFRPKRPPVVRAAPPEPPDDGVRYIPLTQGYHAVVDAEDYERVSRYKWCLSRSGNQLYAQRRCRGKTIRMHQFIMRPPKGKVVDHIDGNGLNNRRGNLRICTPQQNTWNQKRRKQQGASSRFIGVHRHKDRPGKWYVKIKCGDERVNLGPFDSEIEAARARDRKARELFGEYASLNLPPERGDAGRSTRRVGP